MKKADLFLPVTSSYRLNGLQHPSTQSPPTSKYEYKGGHVYSLHGHLNPQQGRCLRQLLPHRITPQRNAQLQSKPRPQPYLKQHQAMLQRLESEIEQLFRFCRSLGPEK